MFRRKRTHGQALVEFALAATLIFFLLAAAVDVGLIFFALQGMHNAAQEGAAYGSRWSVQFDANNAIFIDKNAVIDHVRSESGAKGGNGFINLYDLDSNGVDDRTEHGYNEPNIVIDVLSDPSNDGDPTKNVATGAAENTICTDPSTSTTTCYMRVTVKSVHKMLFAFAPAFAKNVPLTSAYIMPLRSSLSRGSSNNPPPAGQNCTVPNLVGSQKNQVSTYWANANFTGTLTKSGDSTNWIVARQSLGVGASVPCSTSISVYQV